MQKAESAGGRKRNQSAGGRTRNDQLSAFNVLLKPPQLKPQAPPPTPNTLLKPPQLKPQAAPTPNALLKPPQRGITS